MRTAPHSMHIAERRAHSTWVLKYLPKLALAQRWLAQLLVCLPVQPGSSDAG